MLHIEDVAKPVVIYIAVAGTAFKRISRALRVVAKVRLLIADT